MLFVSLLKWWYGPGWARRARIFNSSLGGIIDYFSIDLLLKTLFAPFRQDGAGQVEGSLEIKMRALVDQLISRLLGAIIRIIILIFGIIAIMLYVLFGFVCLAGWVFVPFLPVIGVILAILGIAF